jgi:hypothetical protein
MADVFKFHKAQFQPLTGRERICDKSLYVSSVEGIIIDMI